MAGRCNDLILRSKDKFYISIHHVFGQGSNAGNDADSFQSATHLHFGRPDNFVCNVFSTITVVSPASQNVCTVPGLACCWVVFGTFQMIYLLFSSRLCCAHSIFTHLTFGSIFLTPARCCSDRCAFELSLPIPQSKSQNMADNNVWVPVWEPHSFGPNEILQAYWT